MLKVHYEKNKLDLESLDPPMDVVIVENRKSKDDWRYVAVDIKQMSKDEIVAFFIKAVKELQ